MIRFTGTTGIMSPTTIRFTIHHFTLPGGPFHGTGAGDPVGIPPGDMDTDMDTDIPPSTAPGTAPTMPGAILIIIPGMEDITEASMTATTTVAGMPIQKITTTANGDQPVPM